MLLATSIQAILSVADCAVDEESALRAVGTPNVRKAICHGPNGEDAWDVLCHQGRYPNLDKQTWPCSPPVSLNPPRTDGDEIVEGYHQAYPLCKIPEVGLTISSTLHSIQACVTVGAKRHLEKPVGVTSVRYAITGLKTDECQTIKWPIGRCE